MAKLKCIKVTYLYSEYPRNIYVEFNLLSSYFYDSIFNFLYVLSSLVILCNCLYLFFEINSKPVH